MRTTCQCSKCPPSSPNVPIVCHTKSMNKQTTYKLQWFAERSGEWRDAGFSSRFLPPVQDKMRDDRILCGDTVTFRIVSTIAWLSLDSLPYYVHAQPLPPHLCSLSRVSVSVSRRLRSWRRSHTWRVSSHAAAFVWRRAHRRVIYWRHVHARRLHHQLVVSYTEALSVSLRSTSLSVALLATH